MYLSGQGQERGIADDLLDVLLFKKLDKDFKERIQLKPGKAEDCLGSYELGEVLYPANQHFSNVGLREDEWIKHILLVGMTGSGKTTLAFQMLRQLRKHNKPFLVVDWKSTYRDLLQLEEFKDTKVFTVGRNVAPLFFNPLIPPPGYDEDSLGIWMSKIIEIVLHAYFLGEGVEYLFLEALNKVYGECGWFDGTRHTVPTFEMVKDKIEKMHLTGRMGLWKASAIRTVAKLCFEHSLGPVLNCDNGFDHKKLLTTDVILEMDALVENDKKFLTEALILWLYELRKGEPGREKLKHVLFLEEAHNILSRDKESSVGGETIMESTIRQIREYGQSIVAIDQSPSELSHSMRANSWTKITFNLGDGEDIRCIRDCMNLTEEEKDNIDLLPVGHAVVSLKGRVSDPLHCKFPKISIKKGLITNNILRDKFLSVVS